MCIGRGELFLFDNPSYDEAAAKFICERCPVLVACRKWANNHPELFDVWGGQTPKERGLTSPVMIREQGLVEHGTTKGYAWHRRHHVSPCLACRYANRDANRERQRHARGADGIGKGQVKE